MKREKQELGSPVLAQHQIQNNQEIRENQMLLSRKLQHASEENMDITQEDKQDQDFVGNKATWPNVLTVLRNRL